MKNKDNIFKLYIDALELAKKHKLYEWHDVCDWIEELPYFKEICLED